jgi:hypothetical protein
MDHPEKLASFGFTRHRALKQAYKYDGVKSINGIPTLLSSVLNDRGLKIEILHVKLFCFVISIFFYKGEILMELLTITL